MPEILTAIAAIGGAIAAIVSAIKAGKASTNVTTIGIGVGDLDKRVITLQQQVQQLEQTIALAQQQRQKQQVYTGNIYNTGTVIQQVTGGAAVADATQASEQIAVQDGVPVEWPQVPLETIPQDVDPEHQEES